MVIVYTASYMQEDIIIISSSNVLTVDDLL